MPIEKIRLNKFLAEEAGISRRQADKEIKKGLVFVNNQRVSAFVFINPTKDKVRIQKKLISKKTKNLVYLMFNKPSKVLSARRDSKARPVVMDYMPKIKEKIFLVGRLDWDSEGLLLLTNDGHFSEKILNPKNKISKTYMVKVKGKPSDLLLKKLLKGVSTPVGKRKALFVQKYSTKKASKTLWIKIILNEGKKRQIRLMFDSLGFPVQKLRRVAIGRLKMNKLVKGTFIYLRQKDLDKAFLQAKELKRSFLKKLI
ncbi:MAG: pseudouridine synthase [Bdellovibrionaceae bacterium]|nr:pseudouridine synthase [Pseudobdellovibrionaceae bacterium]